MMVIDIIKSFLKKIKSNKKMLHIEENTKKIKSNELKKDIAVKTSSYNKQIELINLQRNLENKKISVDDLNIFEIIDLIDKYQNDIMKMKSKLKT